MFNSGILDVAIGLIFVYLLLSLIASAANEMIERWLKYRATDLERGIRELLEDPPGTKTEPAQPAPAQSPNNSASTGSSIVQKLYDHPLVNSLFKGTYEEAAKLKRLGGIELPSYIPARNFALAIWDLALKGQSQEAAKA